jgi:two-component system, OmpR family, response regulator
MHVLIIEDEKKIADLISEGLTQNGFTVGVRHDGPEGLVAARAETWDAIVLDCMLPTLDGFGVLKALRAENNAAAILMLSAKGAVDDKISGLECGADDYMSKPFSMEELAARLRALIRRRKGDLNVSYKIGDLHLHLLTRKVTRGTRKIETTGREFALLEHLMRSPGRIIQRQQIMEQVWGYNFDPGTNLVDVYVKRLREKIDADEPVKLLHTVRGMGYMMKQP